MSPRGRRRDRSGPRQATAAPPRERLHEHLLHGSAATLPLELLGRRRNVANHRNPIAVLHDGFSLSARKEREPCADRGVARLRRLTSHPEGGWPRLHMRKACAFVSRDFRLFTARTATECSEGGASAVTRKEKTATDRTGALTRAHGSTRYRASLPCLVPSSRRIEGEEGGRRDGPLETETIRVRAKRACPISGSSSPGQRSVRAKLLALHQDGTT